MELTYNGEGDEEAADGQRADLALVAALVAAAHLPGGEQARARSAFNLCAVILPNALSAFSMHGHSIFLRREP